MSHWRKGAQLWGAHADPHPSLTTASHRGLADRLPKGSCVLSGAMHPSGTAVAVTAMGQSGKSELLVAHISNSNEPRGDTLVTAVNTAAMHAWPLKSSSWVSNVLAAGSTCGRIALAQLDPDEVGAATWLDGCAFPGVQPIAATQVSPSAPALSTVVQAVELAPSASGRFVAACGASVGVFECGHDEPLLSAKRDSGNVVNSVSFASADEQVFLSAGVGGLIGLHDCRVGPNEVRFCEPMQCSIEHVDVCPTQQHLYAAALATGEVAVGDTRYMKHPVVRAPAVSGICQRVAWMPQHCDLVAVAGSTGVVRLWSLRSPPSFSVATLCSQSDAFAALFTYGKTLNERAVAVDRAGTLQTACVTDAFLMSCAPRAASKSLSDVYGYMYQRRVNEAAEALAALAEAALAAGDSANALEALATTELLDWTNGDQAAPPESRTAATDQLQQFLAAYAHAVPHALVEDPSICRELSDRLEMRTAVRDALNKARVNLTLVDAVRHGRVDEVRANLASFEGAFRGGGVDADLAAKVMRLVRSTGSDAEVAALLRKALVEAPAQVHDSDAAAALLEEAMRPGVSRESNAVCFTDGAEVRAAACFVVQWLECRAGSAAPDVLLAAVADYATSSVDGVAGLPCRAAVDDVVSAMIAERQIAEALHLVQEIVGEYEVALPSVAEEYKATAQAAVDDLLDEGTEFTDRLDEIAGQLESRAASQRSAAASALDQLLDNVHAWIPTALQVIYAVDDETVLPTIGASHAAEEVIGELLDAWAQALGAARRDRASAGVVRSALAELSQNLFALAESLGIDLDADDAALFAAVLEECDPEAAA